MTQCGRAVLASTLVCLASTWTFGGPIEVTRYDFDDHVVGDRNISFGQSPIKEVFTKVGDGFGVYQVGVSDPLPGQFLDETLTFPSDDIGVVNSHPTSGKLDAWFGAVDLFVNPDNPSGTGTAIWEFDVSDFTDLSVSIDMAAMGAFIDTGYGHPHSYNWTWSIDGSPAAALFTSSIDADGSLAYTMANGDVETYDAPLLMNGSVLNNTFQTMSATVPDSGYVLTLTLNAEGDGHYAVFVFDDLVITGVPEPATLTLLTLGALLTLRRRR
ncbi:MAG TPA: PEP-CTERM sorting domain-containing protein [Phycisphaerae bacterium]|nr:PEP-CTERM sorting domain-containing protein [Phycisphaerae bacterium]